MGILEFQYITDVAVDSGQLAIGDPCYRNDDRLNLDNENNDAFSYVHGNNDAIIEAGRLPNVGAVMSLIFDTQIGDGMFGVYKVERDAQTVGYFVATIDGLELGLAREL